MENAFGQTSFYNLSLLTAPGQVMTPRPATELLVDRALARLGTLPARVADVGSGSGAIAVTLALLAPRAEVWATDVSTAAVELTRANVAQYGLSDRIHVVQGDLLDAVPGKLDLVAANLPYLPLHLRHEPAYRNLRSEPAPAVFAPGDGLLLYRRLLGAAKQRLTDSGLLLIQFHRRVLEAAPSEFAELGERLETQALAA